MLSRLFVRTCSFWLAAVASSLSLAVSPVHAQAVESQLDQPPSSEPNSIPQNQQIIRRDQAPLPLNRVYQTPIEQFEPAFTDVPSDHWAYEAVTRLFYSGVVKGEPTPANPSTQSN
jgi:hypothetical protein